jgi:hypothetical protein
MKNKVVSIFWGVVLIALGGLWLAGKLGAINFDLFSEQIWVVVFAIASAAFFMSYFLSGVKNWGWLFPALIFAALATTVGLLINGFDNPMVATLILLAVAIPFYVGFIIDRDRWGLLIPAGILTVVSLTPVLSERVNGEWIAALVLYAIALPFLVVWLRDRSKRWALIPAYALGVSGTIPLLSNVLNGNLAGAFVLYAIALPFLYVYLRDHTRRWALIPAAVLAIVGIFPLLDSFIQGDAMGVIVMFLFALPFFVVYFLQKNSWWALIPAGVFASIGLVVLLTLLLPGNDDRLAGVFSGVLFLGFALTFGLLWLRRRLQPTDWAKYPAVGLLATALLAFLLGARFQDYLPAVVLLVVGVVVLVASLLNRKPASDQPAPEEKP